VKIQPKISTNVAKSPNFWPSYTKLTLLRITMVAVADFTLAVEGATSAHVQ